jgi:predicted nucleotidyltransferase component of viral defense system
MFTNAAQLKDYIKNKSKQTGAHTNVLLQNYMMERFLERVSVSTYRKNMILKGGFLIAAMVGVDKRSTMDMDATVKGMPLNRAHLDKVVREIIAIDAGDMVIFEIQDIKNIHDISEYDDFRISMRASIFTIRVDMKIDITTGDVVIPREIEYHYKLMFEDRTIPVMAYNLYTILAEKIETILSRGVGNTRGRDYYDVYLLLSMNKDTLSRSDLLHALREKAAQRGSLSAINNNSKILKDIAGSPDIAKIWNGYTRSYSYAKGIALSDILALIYWVFEHEKVK